METIGLLLDKAREARSLNSDAALAEEIGVSRQLIYGWRQGKWPVPNDRIAQLAEIAKADPAEWLAVINMEHARTTRERKVWKQLLDRLSPAAAAVGLVLLVMSSGIANSALDSVTYVTGESRHYAKCRGWLARFLRHLGLVNGDRHDRASPVLA